MKELCICIRCHDYPEAVMDTIRTVKEYSVTKPIIMLAIDNQDKYGIVDRVNEKYPEIDCFVSETLCGWGAGLYKMFVDALIYAERKYLFKHFVCMDYDTVYTRMGADKLAIDAIASDTTVLVGAKRKPHTGHMGNIKKSYDIIKKHLPVREYSYPYVKSLNRYVLGAYMLLTRYGINKFKEMHYLEDPIRSCLGLKIPDDSWISLLAHTVGTVDGMPTYDDEGGMFPSKNNTIAVTWRLAVPLTDVVKYGLYIYHPVKGGSGGKKMKRADMDREMRVRESLRQLLAGTPNVL